MSYRKKITFFIVFAVIVFFLGGYLLQHPELIGICGSSNIDCIDLLVFSFQQPIRSALPFFILTLIILLFTPERVYNTWKKFAIVAITLEILWIALTPVYCGSIVCFDKRTVAWLSSGLFLGISLVIILVSSLRKKTA